MDEHGLLSSLLRHRIERSDPLVCRSLQLVGELPGIVRDKLGTVSLPSHRHVERLPVRQSRVRWVGVGSFTGCALDSSKDAVLSGRTRSFEGIQRHRRLQVG